MLTKMARRRSPDNPECERAHRRLLLDQAAKHFELACGYTFVGELPQALMHSFSSLAPPAATRVSLTPCPAPFMQRSGLTLPDLSILCLGTTLQEARPERPRT